MIVTMVQQDSTLEMKHHQEHDTRCTSVQLCLQVSLGTKYLIQISIDFASILVILTNLFCCAEPPWLIDFNRDCDRNCLYLGVERRLLGPARLDVCAGGGEDGAEEGGGHEVVVVLGGEGDVDLAVDQGRDARQERQQGGEPVHPE